ncbi:MAG: NHL repeat-containing protein [Verrucomicrobiae bacterium]|nr:NHL repeat-containing protein [Verrucomicrobiae bacterium]
MASDVSGWNGPVGLAVDAAGVLYSGCPGNSTITSYTTNGASSVVGFPVDSVSALAFDHAGSLYVTVPNYMEVARLAYGGFYGYYLSPFEYRSQSHLNLPTSLAFNKAGDVFIANGVSAFPNHNGGFTNTIARFSSNLTYIVDFATNLNHPWGLAFDRAGNLFVANSGNNRIYQFTEDGIRHLFAISGGLSTPKGIAFDSAGRLYVANSGNGTIQRFTPAGLGMVVPGTVIASNLNSPMSIAIYPGLAPWKTPATLNEPKSLPGGVVQFNFSHMVGTSLSALAATNPSAPLNTWTELGGVAEIRPGQFQFTDLQATNYSQRFYRVRAN